MTKSTTATPDEPARRKQPKKDKPKLRDGVTKRGSS